MLLGALVYACSHSTVFVKINIMYWRNGNSVLFNLNQAAQEYHSNLIGLKG